MWAVAADTLRSAGAVLTIPALCVAAGLIAFTALVHRGDRGDVIALLRLALVAGTVAVVGTLIEVAGVARLFGEGWGSALTDRAPAALMRLIAAALVVAGLFEAPELRGATGRGRWSVNGPGVFAVAGALFGVTSFAFDGHTVSRGPRVAHAASDVVHVAAASVWVGGVVGLAVLAWRRRRRAGDEVARLAHTFGRVAAVALGAVAAMGVVMAWFVLDTPSDLWASDWGRTLLVKVTLVGAAAALGAHHHFRPAADVAQLRRTLAIEAGLLVGVLAVTALLVRAAPT